MGVNICQSSDSTVFHIVPIFFHIGQILLAFITARTHCLLITFTLLSTKTHKFFSAKLLPSQSSFNLHSTKRLCLPRFWRTLHLSLLNYIRLIVSQFLLPAQVPLTCSTILECFHQSDNLLSVNLMVVHTLASARLLLQTEYSTGPTTDSGSSPFPSSL